MHATTSLPVRDIVVRQPRRRVNAAHVADLADSIGRLGLLSPVVVTTDSVLVAGRHRLEAVRLLGWTTVPVVVVELSDLQAELAGVDENLVRNDLSRLEHFEHVVRRVELLDALGHRKKSGRPRKSDTVSVLMKGTDAIAGESGLSGRTLQRAVKIVGAIAEDVRASLKGTPLADSTTELLRLSRLPPADQRAVADQVAAGVRGAVNDLHLAVKRDRRRVAASQTEADLDDDMNVHVGHFEEMAHLMPDGEVALFLCDPPYADTNMYGRIARLAREKLKPGGWLAAYCSVHLMAEVMRHLGEHLSYFWTVSIYCTGVSKQCHGFRVRSGWKPILIYQKPPRRLPPDWVNDFHFGGGQEKDHHAWEQPVSEARYLIERLTDAGDQIVDPTCGSGSSLVGAKLAGRKWLGVDVDPEAAQVARLRLRTCGQEQAAEVGHGD